MCIPSWWSSEIQGSPQEQAKASVARALTRSPLQSWRFSGQPGEQLQRAKPLQILSLTHLIPPWQGARHPSTNSMKPYSAPLKQAPCFHGGCLGQDMLHVRTAAAKSKRCPSLDLVQSLGTLENRCWHCLPRPLPTLRTCLKHAGNPRQPTILRFA